MTPKTNREKVEHIRAFDKQFNVKRSKELDFLLMLARYTNGPELTPEAWQQLDDLYHHVLSLEEGEECPKKGPEYIAEPDFMETQEFYDLMQSYRITNQVDQETVTRRYNSVKTFIRKNFTANTEPQEPQTDDSLRTCHACGYTKPANTMFREGGVDYCEGCMNDMT